MKKLALAVTACCLAVAAFSTAGASARGSSFNTEIVVLDAVKSPHGFLLTGVLESDKKKCRSNRDMQMFAKNNPMRGTKRGNIQILDTGTSTDNGAWAFQGEQKFLGQLKVKAFSKTLASGDKCKSETVNVNL